MEFYYLSEAYGQKTRSPGLLAIPANNVLSLMKKITKIKIPILYKVDVPLTAAG
jgi:hypothetical protein